jgi:hypothetical protein
MFAKTRRLYDILHADKSTRGIFHAKNLTGKGIALKNTGGCWAPSDDLSVNTGLWYKTANNSLTWHLISFILYCALNHLYENVKTQLAFAARHSLAPSKLSNGKGGIHNFAEYAEGKPHSLSKQNLLAQKISPYMKITLYVIWRAGGECSVELSCLFQFLCKSVHLQLHIKRIPWRLLARMRLCITWLSSSATNVTWSSNGG